MYDKISDVGKRRGIMYPSFEIYGGLSGFVDYGPVGSRIKQNIEDLFRRSYVVDDGCFEVQCPTVSPEDVWVASGHVGSFSDLLVECVKCGEAYRADKLLEDVGVAAEGKPPEQVKSLMDENGISCPKCKGGFSDPYEYDLMFGTSVGTGARRKTAYLRPETAQTTYLAFKRLWEYARRRLPFGVIQIGHSFRNEISPRQGMIRLREFNQCEIQYFLDPESKEAPRLAEVDSSVTIQDKNEKVHETTIVSAVADGLISIPFLAYQLGRAMKVFAAMGIDPARLTLRQHRDDELAFYSSDTWDVEYVSEAFGKVELVGIADRGEYDLKQHMDHSKEDMRISYEGNKFVPHVIEVAYGVDRPFYCVLESCYREEEERSFFSFPPDIAPFRVGVFSLVKKDGIREKAEDVFAGLRDAGLFATVDHAGSIGKRYARADEIGIPYCVTVDYDTKEDGTVTLRERDSKEQRRVPIEELVSVLRGV